ncbi:putative Inosine-uridine-preferring nucleoside hydrolase [Cardiosporidium cionae]|uniref:Inosine-uridine-preferring nucleoside hydrolase n=1 Tax=Cardiosporidium cionae TaxID=476202 RepID=A0ABQ7JFZ2_9APIC|nr:putative Inosine-uridine-preferring nucleoside hydrolase [Cardiosporidium cionae]|eukprot:KAF8822580.1 putative Inosine-uridine-preferring nucleoside hydrolase [Cardiosporidium cionae]
MEKSKVSVEDMSTLPDSNPLPIPVWLDCDPGHDDAFAILMACYSASINLLGISIVHGNQTVKSCGTNACNFLWAAGVDEKLPVYLGCALPLVRENKFSLESDIKGLGGYDFTCAEADYATKCRLNQSENGVIAMANAIMRHEQKVTIVATGALTNVAILLRLFPSIFSNIERIVFMGGGLAVGNMGALSEFNVYIDPEAAHIVVHSGLPVIMVPLDVTQTAILSDEIIRKIHHVEASLPSSKAAENKLTSAPPSAFVIFCVRLLLSYQECYLKEAPPLHDPCAMYYIMNPSSFETQDLFVDIELVSEKTVGQTICDRCNVLKRNPNVRVCTKMNVEKFWESLLHCISIATQRSPLHIPHVSS